MKHTPEYVTIGSASGVKYGIRESALFKMLAIRLALLRVVRLPLRAVQLYPRLGILDCNALYRGERRRGRALLPPSKLTRIERALPCLAYPPILNTDTRLGRP